MIELQFREVVKLPDGGFDCEIDHPDYGWIPFTARDNDVELHGRQIWEAIVKGRRINPAPLT